MKQTYSICEAKAKLGEILHRVAAEERVIIERRGEPIAEVRPLPRGRLTLERRLEELQSAGALEKEARPPVSMKPVRKIEGALPRFLDERK